MLRSNLKNLYVNLPKPHPGLKQKILTNNLTQNAKRMEKVIMPETARHLFGR